MTTITEGKLTFTFDDDWNVSKYDDWGRYRKQFIKICLGVKAVDVLAPEPQSSCWLLEGKDFRENQRTKTIDLVDEGAEKVRDILAGLVAAAFCANNAGDKAAARQALRSTGLRVVLHLEQPRWPSRLFPRAINPAAVLQRLKQLIKAIAPHPRVVETGTMAGIPWSVA